MIIIDEAFTLALGTGREAGVDCIQYVGHSLLTPVQDPF